MAILGIETSCDETAIAVIDSPNKKVLCEALFSQIDLHNLYVGVVPELAARDHISRLVPLIKNEFEKKFDKSVRFFLPLKNIIDPSSTIH